MMADIKKAMRLKAAAYKNSGVSYDTIKRNKVRLRKELDEASAEARRDDEQKDQKRQGLQICFCSAMVSIYLIYVIAKPFVG